MVRELFRQRRHTDADLATAAKMLPNEIAALKIGHVGKILKFREILKIRELQVELRHIDLQVMWEVEFEIALFELRHRPLLPQ
jgi:hypothetical protein